MDKREHLKLPLFKGNIERKKPKGGGGFSVPTGRNKSNFAHQASQKADEVTTSHSTLKQKFSGHIDPLSYL